MGWAGYTAIALLIFIGSSFAAIIESGDNGAVFVNSTAAAKCGDENVQAVYKCLGNVVRVVSSVPGEGSTFYKPEGKEIRCPVVPPTEMGAECIQMMAPNFCPAQSECGATIALDVFPGRNDTPEQTGDIDAYVVSGSEAGGDAPAVEEDSGEAITAPEAREPVFSPGQTTTIKDKQIEANPQVANDVDAPLGYMVYVVLLLGVGAVGVLFMMFRNSLAEE